MKYIGYTCLHRNYSNHYIINSNFIIVMQTRPNISNHVNIIVNTIITSLLLIMYTTIITIVIVIITITLIIDCL